MKKHFSSAVCMAALLLVAGAAANVTVSPAVAQGVQVDFDTFHDQLAPYGDWVYSDRWGEVWIPTDVSDDFHPYGTRGHWVDTDEYGWTWVSDYEWGDIPFHYGRWVNDPDDGWMWIPGYVWSPGWVAWRHNGRYTGWMPLPPDDAFLGRSQPGVSFGINIGGVSISFGSEGDDYGYSRWYGSDYGRDRYAQNWVFVGTGHIGDRDYGRYQAPRNDYATLVRNTTNITNYTIVNNYIVNRSVDPRAVQQAGGHVQTVKLATVMKKPQFVTRADAGVQIQQRARSERPRGTGFANSAPKPTATIVQSLSVKAPPPHGGHAPMHLFTRDTVAKAPLPEKAGGPPSPEHHEEMKMGPNAPAMTMTPAKPGRHDHEMAPAMKGPAAPAAMTPAETTHEKRDHEMAPAMTRAPEPAAVPAEPKHEKPVHENGPAMMGPAMNGPATAPTEPPKHERHTHDTGPAMMGPAMTGPAAAPEPKHEMRAAPPPVVEHPVAAPVHHPVVEHAPPPPPAPKADKEPPKKHEKPEDAPH